MQGREVGVHKADFHVAHLHLDLLEHVAVLEVLEILDAHVEGREVAEHAQRMVCRELRVAAEETETMSGLSMLIARRVAYFIKSVLLLGLRELKSMPACAPLAFTFTPSSLESQSRKSSSRSDCSSMCDCE
jgi:hypothetical protein